MNMDLTRDIALSLARIAPIKIYREKIEQNFEEPAFYIQELTSTPSYNLMNRDRFSHLFVVHYFPDTKRSDIFEQCEKMREKLMTEFRWISSARLKPLNREVKITEDGVLKMTFSLKYRVAYQEEFEPMTNLESTEGVKE